MNYGYPQGYQQPNQMSSEQVQYQLNSMIQPLNNQMQMINNQITEIQHRFQTAYPQFFQQPNQQPNQQMQNQNQQPQETFSCVPVLSYREAEGTKAPMFGKLICANFKQGEIYPIYLDNDGNKIIERYVKSDLPQEDAQDSSNEFATIGDMDMLFKHIQTLNQKIEGLMEVKQNESRSINSNNTEQSTDSANVSKTTKQSKSNARPTTNDSAEQ